MINSFLFAISLVTSSLGTAGQPVVAKQVPEVNYLNESPAAKAARMKWFELAKFGMFIHWGVYSVPAGAWNGVDYHGASEWLLTSAKIKPTDYEVLQSKFNPVNFNALKWVKIAKAAGMKYIVITSKHHDGFGMWPSKQSDWNIGHGPFHRDPLKELAAACKKQGMKLCFYHSIMDWHNPDYLPRRSWDPRPTTHADFNRYVKYMKAQLKEILTQYGPIGILWFDGEWEETWNHDRGQDLYQYVRSLQPNIIVNNRVDTGRAGMSGAASHNVGDYGTPEQEIPSNGLPGQDWETCMTMNDSWGFEASDTHWKSATEIIHNLADIASKGGNYLLNVGPNSLGEIPAASIERLREVGKWTHANAAAIYGTTAGPFSRKLAWGRVTQKPGKLYLLVFDTAAKTILLPGLQNQLSDAHVLGSSKEESLLITSSTSGPIISLPPSKSTTPVRVFEVSIEGTPKVVNPSISEDSESRLGLVAEDATIHGSSLQVESQNAALGYWTNAADYASWDFNLPKPGTFEVTVSLACEPASAGGTYTVTVGDQQLTGTVPSTGSWTKFIDVKLGTINLDQAGKATLAVKVSKMAGSAIMNLRSVTLRRL